MFYTAVTHQDVLVTVAEDCRLVYRPTRLWPLSTFTPRGPGLGILSPVMDSDQAFAVLSIGVFGLSGNRVELVWKDVEGVSSVKQRVGPQGSHLKRTAAYRETERVSRIFGFKLEILVPSEGGLILTLRR